MDKAAKTQSYTTLNNGMQMPLFGLGAWDMYEKEVGDAVRKSGIPRSEIFVTTKVPNPQQGYDSTLRAFDISIKTLNIDYIDLYLVHWPIRGKRKDTWKALEKLFVDKGVRAIGVANYLMPFLKELETYRTIVPAV